jgi:thiol-disulfide isomerase/thioredoxin
MRAEKIAPIIGLAAIVAMTGIFVVWPPDSSVSSRSGTVSETGPPPQPSGELAPFEWHDEPKELPDLAFATADGDILTLADLRGRVVLVNLWATWCAPCLREMPMLDKLAQAAAGPGFALIALNQDRAGLEVAAPFWDDKGFTALTLYLDTGLVTGRALKPAGLPLTVLIDREGREIARLTGIAAWDDPEVIAYFKALAETPG